MLESLLWNIGLFAFFFSHYFDDGKCLWRTIFNFEKNILELHC